MPPKSKPTRASTLDLVSRLAVSKAKDVELTDLERTKVKPGDYTVDSIVRVVGTLHVQADHDAKQVNKINPYALLLVAMGKLNGVTIDKIVEEAEANAAQGQPASEVLEEKVKAIAARLRDIKEVTVTRRGSVRFDGVILDATPEDGPRAVQCFEGDGELRPG
jgi:hypothetical protein